jgi:hypothetical protein
MLFFNLNVVFTKNILNMGLIRVRFTQDFLQEQDFPEKNFRRRKMGHGEENWGDSKFSLHFTHSPGPESLV